MDKQFPGMDPYLESPDYWSSFHNELIFCVHEELSKQLPAGYKSKVEQRLAIVPDDNYIRADIAPTGRPAGGLKSDRGTSVAERGMPTDIAGTLDEEQFEWYTEIRTVRTNRRVVAVIELLSPSNKSAGSPGWKDYKQKQCNLLCSDTHLLEIDLLRFGTHTVSAPLTALPPRNEWDYIVSLYRAPDRSEFPYWLMRLEDRLPEVRVPLLSADPDVVLDLQAAFDHAYHTGRYADEIDYSVPPTSDRP
jgi:hypothetical protein